MKRNGTGQRVIAARAGLLMFVFAACTDILRPEEAASTGTIPQGKGLAHIRLGAAGEAMQSARTAVPGIGGLYFTLDFTADGETPVNVVLDGGLSLTVALDPVVWNLEVRGYADSTKADLKVSGSTGISITGGSAASFDVYLTPNLASGGTGSLSYSIGLPASVRAFLGLYPIEAPGTPAIPGGSREIDISESAGGTASGIFADLPQGTYRAAIDLYDGGGNKAAVRTEVVHIYAGSATSLNRTFIADNFADCPQKVVGASENTLAAKLDKALESSGSYTIVLDGTETDLASFTPKNLKVTGSKEITVTIRGSGHTVQVGSTGTALLTLGAESGSSLTLVLQDITLRGKSGNNASVVRVNDRGPLVMKAGALITGNTSSGGGVFVSSGGTFTMSGGAVTGNTTSSYGGGVSVSGGTFSMSGGAFSGNTASSSYGGGGVSVGYRGNFRSSGGAVSG
jgi:hypothetical protein